MPHTVNFDRYIEVLRTPDIARLAVFIFLGRLSFAIVGMSVVLLMRREGYDYGEIGVVLAAESVAIASTAAFVGRLADRTGRGRVILALGVATTTLLVLERIAILASVPRHSPSPRPSR